MKKLRSFFTLIIFASIAVTGCYNQETVTRSQDSPTEEKVSQISEDSLLTLTQERTFQYFWDGAEPNSGMARERFHVNNVYPQNDKHIVTTGGSGFGIMAIVIGMERNFITDQQGIDRLERIVKFLKEADRFHGAWPHWLNGETGDVKPFGTKDNGGDLVETSFLAQGLITARQYLRQDGGQEEAFLAAQIDTLWRGIGLVYQRRKRRCSLLALVADLRLGDGFPARRV